MDNKRKVELVKDLKITKIASNVVKTMRNNPEKWGELDWNMAIDIKTLEVSIDHDTTCYKKCCANRICVLISMYGFDKESWFDDSDKPIGTVEEWLDNEMFSTATVEEWLDDENN